MSPRHLKIIGFLSLIVFFAQITLAEPRQASAIDPAGNGAVVKAPPIVDGNYRLSSQDVVKVTVFQEDDLTTTTRIGEDGWIKLPLIGAVNVAGKTVSQASQTIEELYDKDYLVHPQVAITITEFAKRRFTVLGQVQKPGTYEIPGSESLDVIQAIGVAGGYTRSANISKIVLKRAAEGGDRIYKLNGKEMARDGNSKAFKVMPGDTITVEESFF